MNRIQALTGVSRGRRRSLRATRVAVPSSQPHSLFVPLHYEPNYAYPLVVWLHGPGGDQRQVSRVAPLISLRNYAAVGPCGTSRGELGGFDWSDLEVDEAERRVFESVEEASSELNIAPRRVFLAGYQTGGTMALRIALRNVERFAGALSVGGPFPTGAAPLRDLHGARRLPLFLANGRDSELYPVDRTCEELRLFHAAGLCVTIRQYPCGDELDSLMLHDMDVWMMEQVTGARMDCECQPRSDSN